MATGAYHDNIITEVIIVYLKHTYSNTESSLISLRRHDCDLLGLLRGLGLERLGA